MNMLDKVTTANILNSIDVNTIFAQVLKTEPTQEAPGAYEKFSFERGYNIFGERGISIIFKE